MSFGGERKLRGVLPIPAHFFGGSQGKCYLVAREINGLSSEDMIKRPDSAGKIITCQSRSLIVVTCSWNWQTKIDWHLFIFLKESYCQRNHKPGKSLWRFKPINHSSGPWKCTDRNWMVSAIQPDEGEDLSPCFKCGQGGKWTRRKLPREELGPDRMVDKGASSRGSLAGWSQNWPCLLKGRLLYANPAGPECRGQWLLWVPLLPFPEREFVLWWSRPYSIAEEVGRLTARLLVDRSLDQKKTHLDLFNSLHCLKFLDHKLEGTLACSPGAQVYLFSIE